MTANEYKLKDGTTMEEILMEVTGKHLHMFEGGSFIHKDAQFFCSNTLASMVNVYIAFPSDLTAWDGFDYVLVLDEDFGQPYTPFYDGKLQSKFLDRVIANYNTFMDSLSFLERKD